MTTEEYDRMAEEYHAATGDYAPGKDVPAEMGRSEEDYEARSDRFLAWLRRDKCNGALRLTDDCYGMAGGRRFDCTVCGSYFVTPHNPNNHPWRCDMERKAS